MKKKLFSKIMTFSLSVALVLGMSATAFAANTDPNMTDAAGQFTYVLDEADVVPGGASQDLYAGPADNFWQFTGFSTSAAAINADWTTVDGSTAGIDLNKSSITFEDMGTNEFASVATVDIDGGVTSGVASFKVMNPLSQPVTGAAVNLTVLVNPTSLAADSEDVNFEVYAPSATTPTASGTIDVAANGYYSDINFVTVMDGMPAMLSNSIINNYNISYGSVTSMTLGTNKYDQYTVDNGDGTYTYYGWQYRVERNNQILDLSAVVGADNFDLQSDDTVIWKFGAYDDDTLFN